ncbi:MAG: hypothetical protein ABSF63_13240 [Candidatus Bathyarchaeia archaeon]
MRYASKLKLENVEDVGYGFLKCRTCGQTWSPNIQRGGRLPDGYAECPNKYLGGYLDEQHALAAKRIQDAKDERLRRNMEKLLNGVGGLKFST